MSSSPEQTTNYVRFPTKEGDSWWTAERIGLLVVLRHGGASSEEIARRLVTTRHAVCGKAHRLNLAPPPKPRPRPVSLRDRHRLLPRPAPAGEAASAQAVPLLDRSPDQCGSILDARAEGGLALCCGRPTYRSGSPWCIDHFLLYTEPPKENFHGKTRYRD